MHPNDQIIQEIHSIHEGRSDFYRINGWYLSTIPTDGHSILGCGISLRLSSPNYTAQIIITPGTPLGRIVDIVDKLEHQLLSRLQRDSIKRSKIKNL